MIKGDKIKLIRKMGVFDNIGEICEVTDVTDDGVICFRFGENGVHLGCMSYNEFEKYFELVNNKWTGWTKSNIGYYNLDKSYCLMPIEYRHNNKIFQMRTIDKSLKSIAVCNKCDSFDFDKGFNLVKSRLIIKILQSELDKYKSTM
ncbi:MAG: hypothetical protein ACLTVG_02315 [Coprococcus sp.]